VVIAALNHCKNNNIKNVGWHCWDNNIQSYKLAEKVGFQQKKNIKVYFGWYDLYDNYLINGNYYIKKMLITSFQLNFILEPLKITVGFYGNFITQHVLTLKSIRGKKLKDIIRLP